MAKQLSILNEPPILLDGPQILHELVLWEEYPLRSALEFTSGERKQSYSYRDLESCATSLGLRIKEALDTLNCGAVQQIVPTLLPQSPGLYISYLAILASGGAFCPINLDVPRDRIKFITDDVDANILITTSDYKEIISWENGPLIILIDEFISPPQELTQRLQLSAEVNPNDLAYVMYTSGSTGLPKGVGVTHLAVSQSLLAHQKYIPPFKRFLQFAAPSFDVSVFEIFFPLTRACTLVGCNRNQLLDNLPGVIKELDVDAVELTPTVIGSLIEKRSNVPGLKLLLTIGEMLTSPVVMEFGGSKTKPSILYALYGPTEATIHCTIHPEMAATMKPNNIGIPLETVSTFIIAPNSSIDETANLDLLPIEELGELVLSGPQLARGYIKQGEQKNQAFFHSKGRKYYKTGDKARQLQDGSIEIYGRITEDQVKIRGQRIELGEIEEAIYKHPGIKTVTAAVIRGNIIVFVIASNIFMEPKDIIKTCSKWLPKFMIPSEIILRSSFPYLTSGKVDKSKLKLEYQKLREEQKIVDDTIESESEKLVIETVQDILGPFSRQDRLAAVGLDSLVAIKIASKLRDLGFIINTMSVLQAQSLNALISLCVDSFSELSMGSTLIPNESLRTIKNLPTYLNFQASDIDYMLPCTPQQLAMLSESVRDKRLYRNWVELEILGVSDHEYIIQVLHDLSKFDPILRTGFAEYEGPDRFFQIIYKKIPDARFELVTNFKYDFDRSKDSSLEYPLRFQILTRFPNMKLLVHIHHAIYDAWSLELMLDDLDTLLARKPLYERPSFELVVNSYSASENLTSEDWTNQDYWKDHLTLFSPRNLPKFYPNTCSASTLKIFHLQTSILTSDVEVASRKLLTSLQSIFQAAFALILSSYIGTSDICFGSVVSGRTLPIKGIENIVGPCLATLPIRIDLSLSDSFYDLVQQLNSTNRKHLEHIIPLKNIKLAGGIQSSKMLFDTVVIWQQTLHPYDYVRNYVSIIDSADTFEFNLILEIIPHRKNIELRATYQQGIMPQSQVSLLLQQVEQLTHQILKNNEIPLSTAFCYLSSDLLSIENQKTETKILGGNLHEIVEKIALEDPDKPAIRFAHSIFKNRANIQIVSYSELNSRANKIACCLIELGTIPDQLVCICLEKSVELYTSILATTKTGAAWLPLIPDTPLNQLNYILQHELVQVIITHSNFRSKLKCSRSIKFLLVDKLDFSSSLEKNPLVKVSPDSLAYCIFTSGSTGQSKGVLITQRNIISHLSTLETLYPVSKETRLLQSCSHTFDVSVADIFFTWRIRGCLCSATNDVLFRDFENAIRIMKVTHLSLTPTVAALIDPKNVPSVEFLITAGEAITHKVYNSWINRGLRVGYGPSETTNIVTLYTPVTGNDLPGRVGDLLKTTSAFVLSSCENFVPVPRGGEGELCFGGSQVFRGYIEKHHEKGKFIEHPEYGRIYRSGDLGRLMPDGSLFFLNRNDSQVKIRGQRVELGEINNVIMSKIPETGNCTTMIIEGQNNTDQRLICFWASKHNYSTDFLCLQPDQDMIKRLRQSLTSALPIYMIPSAVIPVSFIPTTESGKIDSARLIKLFNELSVSYLDSTFHAPEPASDYHWSPLEIKIVTTIAQVTNKSKMDIGADTSFFSLGIDSISAIFLSKVLANIIGYQPTVSEILRFPSVMRLAAHIVSHGENLDNSKVYIKSLKFGFDKEFHSSIVQEYKRYDLSVQSILPCTPLQEAMLSAAEYSSEAMYYNRVTLEVRGDLSKLLQCWREMVRRHEILRTCFKRTELKKSVYIQVILTDYDLQFNYVSSLSERRPHFEAYKPPYTLEVLHTAERDKLIIKIHHALYDAMAMSVLYDEIQALYHNRSLEPAVLITPFLEFLESKDHTAADLFWSKVLKNCTFPKLKPQFKAQHPEFSTQFYGITLEKSLQMIKERSAKYETSILSLFMTIWACVLAERLKETDICFGNVVSGRNIPVPGVERLVAPCFCTVPSRLRNIEDLSYLEAFRIFQKLNAEVLPFQFTPLRRIQTRLNLGGSRLFDTIFILQQPQTKLDPSLWSLVDENGSTDFPLVCEIIPCNHDDNLKLNLYFYSSFISENDGAEILQSFKQKLHVALQNPRKKIQSPSLNSRAFMNTRLSRDEKRIISKEIMSQTLSRDEKEICNIIANFSDFSVEKISRKSSIFYLGLDSINITQFASCLRKKGYNVQVSDIFEHPTIRELSCFLKEQVDGKFRATKTEFEEQNTINKNYCRSICIKYGISYENVEAFRPCTSFQQGLIARTIQSNGKEYFNSIWFELPIETSISRFKDAWMVAGQGHEIFRTGIASIEDIKCPFVMVTHRNFQLPWYEVGTHIKAQLTVSEILMHNPWSLTYFPYQNDKILIQFTVHHALYDALSIEMLLLDVARSYKSLNIVRRPPISLLYNAVMMHSQDQLDEKKAFWERNESRIFVNRFPDLNPVRILDTSSRVQKRISNFHASDLENLCRENSITMQTAGQAAWARLLANYIGEASTTFGVTLSGRSIFEDADKIPFPSTVTIPVHCNVSGTNKEFLTKTMNFNSKVNRYQFTPLSLIKKWSGNSNSQIFDTLFTYRKFLKSENDIEQPWKLIREDCYFEYVVSLELQSLTDNSLVLILIFRLDFIPTEQASIILEQYEELLIDLLSNPNNASDISPQTNTAILSVALAKNPTLPGVVNLLHEYVEQGACNHPEKIAFEFATSLEPENFQSKCFTFEELNRFSNMVANLLIHSGIKPGEIVAICFDKCPEATFASIGILKSGCVCVALDPNSPVERSKFILKDSGAKILLVGNKFGEKIAKLNIETVINLDINTISSFSRESPKLIRAITPEDVSYILYTSGTTGTPKGCLITHDNIVHFMRAFSKIFENHWSDDSKYLQFASYHFDVSIMEQFWSWSIGIRVVSAPRDLIFENITRAIQVLGITHIDLTPSLARMVHPEDVPSLCKGAFVTGGEQLEQEILDEWGKYSCLYNGYGPTEATIGCTMNPRVSWNSKPANIGPAYINVGTFVLKPDTEIPVLQGGVGELCVSGKLIGKGYLNNPDLTAKKFPTLKNFDKKVYRTGDLVRNLYDGSFIFLGRADNQVKLRGQRLELNEIKQVIKNHVNKIDEVVTLVLKHTIQLNDRLVTFFVTNLSDPSDLIFAMKSACKSWLPSYMIPSHFIPVEKLPLSPNNKVDTVKLANIYKEYKIEDLQKLNAMTPQENYWSDCEQKVLEKISSAINVELSILTRSTNIFELGLDSISIIGLSRSLQSMGLENANLSIIRNNPSMDSLVKALLSKDYISNSKYNEHIQIVQNMAVFSQKNIFMVCNELGIDSTEIESVSPCTPLQEGMIYKYLESKHALYFNKFIFRLHERAETGKLLDAWNCVISHLEILRTKFVATDDGFCQVVMRKNVLTWDVFRDYNNMDKIQSLRNPYSLSLCANKLTFQIFHGLYDQISLKILLNHVINQYIGMKIIDYGPSFISSLPFGPMAKLTGAQEFWTLHLKDWSTPSLPINSNINDDKVISSSIIDINGFEKLRKKLHVAPQAIVEACWIAVLCTKFCSNLTMGIIMSGRSIEFENVESIVGPLFNTVPFNIILREGMTLEEIISTCHNFNMRVLDFQNTPLKEIQKWIPTKNKNFELFQMIFNFQRQNIGDYSLSNDLWTLTDTDHLIDYPLALNAELSLDSSQLSLTLITQGSILSQDEANNLIGETVTCIRTTLSSLGLNRAFDDLILIDPSPRVDSKLTVIDKYPMESENFVWNRETFIIKKEIAKLANVNQDVVKENSPIYELGLDSIDVIKLFTRLKKQDVMIPVSEIIKCQTIAQMLHKIEHREIHINKDENCFHKICQDLMLYFKKCGNQADGVETILPATPLQQSMVSEMKKSGFKKYFTVDCFKIACGVDLIKLQNAIDIVVEASPILRTTFQEVDEPSIPVRFAQMIHKYSKTQHEWESILLDEGQSFEDYLNKFREEAVTHATKTHKLLHFRYFITNFSKYLIIAISHSLYDGTSLQLIHEDIKRVYDGQILSPRPDYIPYLTQIFASVTTDAKCFWKNTLSEIPWTKVPVKSNLEVKDLEDVHILEKRSSVSLFEIKAFCRSSKITLQTLGQTCWALVLSQLMKQLDVVFGTVLRCRDSEEAAEVMFPLMNTVVLRSIIHGNLNQMLIYMQEMGDTIRQYQNFPLGMAQSYAFGSNDRRSIVKETNRLFDTLFIYQGHLKSPQEIPLYERIYGISNVEIPICVEMQVIGDNYISWITACKSTVRNYSETEALLQALESVLRRIVSAPNSPTLEIDRDGISICGLLPKIEIKSFQPNKKEFLCEIFQENRNKKFSSTEQSIRKALSELSNVSEDEIHKNMNIYHLGLDSILALKLPTLLKDSGIKISMSSILNGQNISAMAIGAQIIQPSESSVLKFSDTDRILGEATSFARASHELKNIETEVGPIQYLMPVTAGQYYMLKQWQISHGAKFYSEFSIIIRHKFDECSIEMSWRKLLQRHAILRTGFFEFRAKLYQVVYKDPPNQIISMLNTDFVVEETRRSKNLDLRFPPINLVVEKKQPVGYDFVRLKLIIHHALYDGISLPLLLDDFLDIYHGRETEIHGPPLDFNIFVAQSYSASQTEMVEAKWKSYIGHEAILSESSGCRTKKEVMTKLVTRTEVFLPSTQLSSELQQYAKDMGYSLDIIFLATLVQVQAQRCKITGTNSYSKDQYIWFGLYVANRAPFGEDLSQLMAPTLNILPLRIHKPLDKTLFQVAHEIQSDIRKITTIEPDMISVSLSQIFQWTGIRVNFCVNILKSSQSLLSSSSSENQDLTPAYFPSRFSSSSLSFSDPNDAAITPPNDFINASKSKHRFSNTVQTQDMLPPQSYTYDEAYLPSIEIEIYHHENMIDVGIFGPEDLITVEEGEKFVDQFIESLNM